MTWKNLKETGLKEKEAKILYSLMQLKEAKASEIAKSTGISRVRVYDILKELYSKGLIRKKKGRPTKYISLSPEETLERILDWKKEQFNKEKEKIQENKKEIQQELAQTRGIEEEKPRNLLEFISLGEVSEKETKEIIQNSEEQVKIMSEALSWIDSIEEELRNTDSEVKVLLLDPGKIEERAKEPQEKAIEKLKEINADIHFTDKMPLRGCITDKEAVLNVREKESSNLLRDCIYTNHDSFLQAMSIYFDEQWKDSKRG